VSLVRWQVFVLEVLAASSDGMRVRWSQVTPEGVGPCPRSRQTMTELGGKLYVFGGSDEGFTEGGQREGEGQRIREVDTGEGIPGGASPRN
jgi:hypothetical protein